MPVSPFPSPICPPPAILEQLGLATPFQLDDQDQFAGSVRSILDEYQRSGIAWHPLIDQSSQFLHDPTLHNISLATFSSLSLPVSHFAQNTPARINLLQPPIIAAGPKQLSHSLNDWQITVACDHFVQAECLAAAAQKAHRTIAFDLRIDVGPNRWGVSPGNELMELTRGISRLAGAKLRGLLLPPRNADHTESPRPIRDDEYIRLAVAAVNSMRDTEHTPERLLVDSLETAKVLADSCSNIPRVSIARLPAGDSCIVAGVIARPLRETAILNAGYQELGCTPTLISSTSWRAEFVGRHFTRLRYLGHGDQLSIGDLVRLRPASDAIPIAGIPRLIGLNGIWQLTRDF